MPIQTYCNTKKAATILSLTAESNTADIEPNRELNSVCVVVGVNVQALNHSNHHTHIQIERERERERERQMSHNSQLGRLTAEIDQFSVRYIARARWPVPQSIRCPLAPTSPNTASIYSTTIAIGVVLVN